MLLRFFRRADAASPSTDQEFGPPRYTVVATAPAPSAPAATNAAAPTYDDVCCVCVERPPSGLRKEIARAREAVWDACDTVTAHVNRAEQAVDSKVNAWRAAGWLPEAPNHNRAFLREFFAQQGLPERSGRIVGIAGLTFVLFYRTRGLGALFPATVAGLSALYYYDRATFERGVEKAKPVVIENTHRALDWSRAKWKEVQERLNEKKA